MSSSSTFSDKTILKQALKDSFIKLDPRVQYRNPVMLITWIGALVVTCVTVQRIAQGTSFGFELQLALWLWFTVLFANFSEALAEGRGKAQAESMKKTRSHTMARKLVNGSEQSVVSLTLRKGDDVVCETGDVIPGDGEIINGIATVDESAITESLLPSCAKPVGIAVRSQGNSCDQ